MDAKEYLSQALWLDKMIENKMDYQESIRTLAERARVDLSREKICRTFESTNFIENTTIKLIDLSREIDEDLGRFFDLKKEIQKTIDNMDNMSHRILLEMRYINNKDWNTIARDMNYDRSTIFRKHGKAISLVQLKIDNL